MENLKYRSSRDKNANNDSNDYCAAIGNGQPDERERQISMWWMIDSWMMAVNSIFSTA